MSTPENYALTSAALMQNSIQNFYMGAQAGRDQRYLELQIREQRMAERHAALEEELNRARMASIRRQEELNEKLAQQNAELEQQLIGKNENVSDRFVKDKNTVSKNSYTAAPLRKKEVVIPDDLNYYSDEIKVAIDNIRRAIDINIANGRIEEAVNYEYQESVMDIFPGWERSHIAVFIKEEVKQYKELALKAYFER